MSHHKEHIIAVFAEKFNQVAKDSPQKGNIYPSEMFEGPIVSNDVIVANRGILEEDTRFRQIIPYIAFKNKNGEFLTYVRTKSSGESGLHSKTSVGFGGHMDAEDIIYDDNNVVDVLESIKQGVTRETLEELGDDVYEMIKENIENLEIQNLIIDDKTKVEQVHMAVMIVVEVEESFDVESEDPSIDMKGFLSLPQIKSLHEAGAHVEPWSEIVINNQ